ncbi:MAG: peroxiredoxin [Alphaproteobacteria bacterium]|nr:peroxiredoxin [Alphaproteobacteria bacterium]
MAKKNHNCEFNNQYDENLYDTIELQNLQAPISLIDNFPEPMQSNPSNTLGIGEFPFGPIPPMVTNIAPDFSAAAIMPDNSVKTNFNLKKHLKGSYGVIFFYPANFTFVCPSELVALNNRRKEFEEKNTKIVAISVDSIYAHLAWKDTPISKGGIKGFSFPLISDVKKTISESYRILGSDGVPLRGTFIIDKHGKIVHQTINDLPFGRNPQEILHMIDAMQHYEKTYELCPVGWKKGKDGILADSESVNKYMARNHKSI